MQIVVFSFFAQCLQPLEIQTHKNLSTKKIKKNYKNICIYRKSGISLSSSSGIKPERLILFIHLLNFFIMVQTVNTQEFYNFCKTSFLSIPFNSQFAKVIKFYSFFLLDKLQEDYKDFQPSKLSDILLNGSSSWREYSYNGNALIYNEDLENLLLKPNARKYHPSIDGSVLLEMQGGFLLHASLTIQRLLFSFLATK